MRNHQTRIYSGKSQQIWDVLQFCPTLFNTYLIPLLLDEYIPRVSKNINFIE